jgi:hypothetical protein
VIEGELSFYLGEAGELMRVTAGADAYVPAGMPHAFRVTSEKAAIINCTTANHEQFFYAVGEPVPRSPARATGHGQGHGRRRAVRRRGRRTTARLGRRAATWHRGPADGS